MKKIHLNAIFIFSINLAFAQWTKINSIPSRNIIAPKVYNNQLYAASDSNIIYKTGDGLTWDALKK